MALALKSLAIPDNGIDARVPESAFSVLTLVEVRNRMVERAQASNQGSVTPADIATALSLSEAQVCELLSYYRANQAAFDEALSQRKTESDAALAVILKANGSENKFGEIVGSWPGNETDEEIEAALERMS